ncbi:LysO family transporter [Oceanirhabdus seepicola]|uniref:LysO family transporter n=1 Tax=Oceanirhabdus seepicola TaxID=2828781 RepID=A0A9J6P6N1_9CLOT|nr:LysO family transporter [Oceanirhabdus seepicola]MCM1992251.1 LysO family transporter [Oceanirhabdus seepicola]
MWSILVVLLVGIIIGGSVKLSDKMKAYNSKFQFIGVVFLLFTMGVSLGLNKSILNNLKSIGIKSLVFAVLTSLFSVIMVYFTTKFILKGDKK